MILVLGRFYRLNIHAKLLKQLDFGGYGCSVGMNAVLLLKDLNQLSRCKIVLLVGLLI